MPMDTVRAATPARSFALRLIAWSLALFGLLRLPWVGTHILLPVTRVINSWESPIQWRTSRRMSPEPPLNFNSEEGK